MNEFKLGDVVILKSGGPRMTVNSILEDGKIECTWFDDKNTLQYQSFKQELLKHYKPPSMRIGTF